MANPSVSIVIPAWNSEAQLKQNLPSVFAASKQVGAKIIVVDDFSTQDSTLSFLRSLGDQIQLIENPQNLGFAATVNRGVEISQSDIVVLLNTDVRPGQECFSACLKQFKNDDIFAVTFNSDNSWAGGNWSRGLLEHSRVKADKSNITRPNPSLWASGGQAAFSRKKWNELGGLDTMYAPFYWEDVDLGYRAWKRGWQIIWDPSARCVHDHTTSVISGNYQSSHIHSIAQRNQFLFVWKNIHDSKMIWSHLIHIPSFIKNYPKAFFAALALIVPALVGRRVEKSASVRSDSEILQIWN